VRRGAQARAAYNLGVIMRKVLGFAKQRIARAADRTGAFRVFVFCPIEHGHRPVGRWLAFSAAFGLESLARNHWATRGVDLTVTLHRIGVTPVWVGQEVAAGKQLASRCKQGSQRSAVDML